MTHAVPSKLAVASAYAAVWFIWGSTYLAIAWVLETLPPFLMAGGRFLLAGGLMLAWCAAKRQQMPTRAQWTVATITGGLMLLGGNGGVVWAEQHLPSGFVALLVASVPAWMVLFQWLQPGGTRPTRVTIAGLALGFVGVGLLVAPSASVSPSASAAVVAHGTHGAVTKHGLAAIAGLVPLAGSACWALGSILSRRGGLPASPLVSTAAQMIGGGACLTIAGLAAGEAPAVWTAQVSGRSAVALAYLVIFGSIVAFTCYAWLLRVSTPAKVSTYAYVNPVVAVSLGTLAGEPFEPRMIVAGALIVAGVASITAGKRQPAPVHSTGTSVRAG